MIRIQDHPLPWVAKFSPFTEGGNVYDANDRAIFSDRLDLLVAGWIAAGVNGQAAELKSRSDEADAIMRARSENPDTGEQK